MITVNMTLEDALSPQFIAMEPLYERLLEQKFVTNIEGIDYCSKACLEYGFTIKHETGVNGNIFIYCSRGDHHQATQIEEMQQIRKRPSSLKTNDCKWKIVLFENEFSEWTFRKSLNPYTSEHNHRDIILPEVENKWSTSMMTRLAQLVNNNQSTDEVRATLKAEYPNVVWNEARYINYVTEQQKRQKQKSTLDRVQKLIMASTKLCSVVAANEDWAGCVESDLSKLLESYRKLTRVSRHSLDNMVDLQPYMIHSEIDNNVKQQVKKRKMAYNASEGVQVMSIPSCTLFIRSQPLRSLSEPSGSNNHHHFNRRSSSNTSNNNMAQLFHQNESSFVGNVFNLTSPVSSPSSTSSIQQRMDHMLQSPPVPNESNTPTSNYMYSFSPYQQNQQGGQDYSFVDTTFNNNNHRYYTAASNSNSSRVMPQEYENSNHLPIIRSNHIISPHHHHHHHHHLLQQQQQQQQVQQSHHHHQHHSLNPQPF